MSAAKLVAAIDHGTTSTRCILFARDGTPAAIAQREQTMYYPRPGWLELDMGRSGNGPRSASMRPSASRARPPPTWRRSASRTNASPSSFGTGGRGAR
jgi:FGGY family of carbohydrate kinases, N-terminal domain